VPWCFLLNGKEIDSMDHSTAICSDCQQESNACKCLADDCAVIPAQAGTQRSAIDFDPCQTIGNRTFGLHLRF
jgi:hypothetical protein